MSRDRILVCKKISSHTDKYLQALHSHLTHRSSDNSHTRPPPTSSPLAWQKEGIPTASPMEKHCFPFDPVLDDVLSLNGNAHTRPPPNLSSLIRPEKWMPTVSPMEKRSSPPTRPFSLTRPEKGTPIVYMYTMEKRSPPLTLPFCDVFSFSGHAHTNVRMVWVPTSRWKYRFILLEWGWYFEKH